MASAPSAPRTLRRRQRLKSGRDFLRVKAQGRRMAHGCLIANWLVLPPGSASRLGVVTGRALGGAVVRNRARRLLRETYRRHRHELRQPVDLVLVARSSIVGRKLAEVEKDYLEVLQRARLGAEAA
ncbi:MAG: ribonuclease P protein component [Verrucomicrobia bacterium]|nr:ribonuclease P protein component [Verrucomicrobiota bacterium]